MKSPVLLVVDSDPNSLEMVARSAVKTGHDLLRAETSREAFRVLDSSLPEVDLVVIDVDPGGHGLAVLEAIDASPTAPPVIVLTSLEEAYMTPISAAHGAAACVGKPFTVEKLAFVIEYLTTNRTTGCACSEGSTGTERIRSIVPANGR